MVFNDGCHYKARLKTRLQKLDVVLQSEMIRDAAVVSGIYQRESSSEYTTSRASLLPRCCGTVSLHRTGTDTLIPCQGMNR